MTASPRSPRDPSGQGCGWVGAEHPAKGWVCPERLAAWVETEREGERRGVFRQVVPLFFLWSDGVYDLAERGAPAGKA